MIYTADIFDPVIDQKRCERQPSFVQLTILLYSTSNEYACCFYCTFIAKRRDGQSGWKKVVLFVTVLPSSTNHWVLVEQVVDKKMN